MGKLQAVTQILAPKLVCIRLPQVRKMLLQWSAYYCSSAWMLVGVPGSSVGMFRFLSRFESLKSIKLNFFLF